MSLLIPTVLAAAAFATVVLVLLKLPRSPKLTLQSWPAPLWIYTQALLSLTTKLKRRPVKYDQALLKLEVSLAQPTQFNLRRFQGFLRLIGHDNMEGHVPLMYPIVESFRLVMQAMLLPQFPFNILGSVLARNSCTMYRAMAADERLVYRCEVDPHFRPTPKGHTEVDLLITATSARDNQLVWRDTLTVVIISLDKPKNAAAGTAATSGAATAIVQPLATRTVLDTWHLGGDTGRKFGMLNGDLNPIHLHPVLSSIFGYKRPIVHALYLVSRAEATLRNKGVVPHYPAVLDTEFKRPTLLPATLQCEWTPVQNIAAAMKGDGIHFAVTTEDRQKDVVVGHLHCNVHQQ